MLIIALGRFRVVAHAHNGRIRKADRPVRWLEGRSLESVLALAKRRGWEVQLTDVERMELAQTDSAPAQSVDRREFGDSPVDVCLAPTSGAKAGIS